MKKRTHRKDLQFVGGYKGDETRYLGKDIYRVGKNRFLDNKNGNVYLYAEGDYIERWQGYDVEVYKVYSVNRGKSNRLKAVLVDVRKEEKPSINFPPEELRYG